MPFNINLIYNKIDEKLMTNAIETIIRDDDDVDLPE
jgi:hypothetical protein